jgi:hypothetical protein
MGKPAFASLLVTALLMAGCVPCLQPVYTDEDLVFEADLIGTWTPVNSKALWEFTRADDRSYRLVQTDANGASGQFSAHLFKIRGTTFLDLYPEMPHGTGSCLYASHFRPVHTCFRVQQISPKLRISIMNPQWAHDYLKANRDAVQHTFTDRGVVLTAPTKELQTFLAQHCGTKASWHDLGEMTRVPDR